MRKYEIYLPLKYNDGKEIEPEKIKRIREELIDMFGAITVSSRSSPYQGTWKYGGVDFIDDIIKFEIIAGADKKNRGVFSAIQATIEATSQTDRHTDYSAEYSDPLNRVILRSKLFA